MTQKYSVQFEASDDSPSKLLMSAVEVSDSWVKEFPVSCSTGYVDCIELAERNGHPKQSFWFAVVDTKGREEAYRQAVLALLSADLKVPFPVTRHFIEDIGLNKL